MTTKSYKPSRILSQFIDRYYIVQKSSDSFFDLPIIFPNTGLDLIFHKGEPLKFDGANLPQIHTVCPRRKFQFDKTHSVDFISIRFKSGRFRHFTNKTFEELNNNFISAEILWGEKSNILSSIMKNDQNNESTINEIELFLIEIFNIFSNKNFHWDLVIDDLYYNHNITIEELSCKYELSTRQFQRNFKKQFGTTAKKFQQTVRFQNVIKKALLSKKSEYLDIALDNGYFDQSHFINDFKKIASKKPSEYFTTNSFNNHFFHEPL